MTTRRSRTRPETPLTPLIDPSTQTKSVVIQGFAGLHEDSDDADESDPNDEVDGKSERCAPGLSLTVCAYTSSPN